MRPPRNFVPHPFAYHEEVELEIDDLSSLGQGVGRVDGWVIFVPFALPGERVRARVWRNKSNFSDADLLAVIRPSPDRVEPPCPLFGQCGGCQYQHLAYPAQLDWKTRQIRELLRRLGGLDVPVERCQPSPKTYHYRSKITPHYPPPRGESRPLLGFEKVDSRALIDVPHCPISSEAINAALPGVRERLRERVGTLTNGGTVLLRDTLDGVVTDMRAMVREAVGDRVFRFVAGEFFQNNPHILPALVAHTLAEARRHGATRLVDVYCGVGVFALCAVGQFAHIQGIEVNANAVRLARENAIANGSPQVLFREGSAEAIFGDLDWPPRETAFIIDPPRKGCDEGFLHQLVAYGPRVVVYVSCGPDTQARDAKHLVASGYSVTRVQPFDLFPQTRHVENVMTFVREG